MKGSVLFVFFGNKAVSIKEIAKTEYDEMITILNRDGFVTITTEDVKKTIFRNNLLYVLYNPQESSND